MDTSRTVSFKRVALRFIALPLAFAPLAGAFADDGTASDGDAVATLKSSLQSSVGFEVDNVRVTDAGVACINYRVPNDTGGESRAQAVVEGDKVLRSTSRNTRFAKAWNSKCVGAGGGA